MAHRKEHDEEMKMVYLVVATVEHMVVVEMVEKFGSGDGFLVFLGEEEVEEGGMGMLLLLDEEEEMEEEEVVEFGVKMVEK